MEIGRQLKSIGLEAVLIGNAAAALQGAPVTTVDFDFMFRKTPRNLRKLKTLATALGATVMRPYYPASDLYRVVRDDGLQLDFMPTIHGVRSFEGLRDRGQTIDVGGTTIRVASLREPEFRPGLADRIWWGSSSNRTARWTFAARPAARSSSSRPTPGGC